MAYSWLLLDFYSGANRTLTVDKEGKREGQMIAENQKKKEHILKLLIDIRHSFHFLSKFRFTLHETRHGGIKLAITKIVGMTHFAVLMDATIKMDKTTPWF